MYYVNNFTEEKSNFILQTVINESISLNKNSNVWTNKVKALLQNTGFYDVWLFPDSVNLKRFVPLFRNRLIDMYISERFQDISIKSSLSIFKHIKSSFEWSDYLTKMKISSYRNAVAK